MLRRWAGVLVVVGLLLYALAPSDSDLSVLGACLLMLSAILGLSSLKARKLLDTQSEAEHQARVLAEWSVAPLQWRRYVRHWKRTRWRLTWVDGVRIAALVIGVPALLWWESRNLWVAAGIGLMALIALLWIVETRSRAAERMLMAASPCHARVRIAASSIHIAGDRILCHLGPGTGGPYAYRVKSVEIIGGDPALLRIELRRSWSAFSNMMRRLQVDLPCPPGGRVDGLRVRSALLEAAAGQWPVHALTFAEPVSDAPPALPDEHAHPLPSVPAAPLDAARASRVPDTGATEC